MRTSVSSSRNFSAWRSFRAWSWGIVLEAAVAIEQRIRPHTATCRWAARQVKKDAGGADISPVPDALRDRLALAMGLRTYRAYRDLLDSEAWQRLANSGARAQRLLWASTSTKDPAAPDTLYVHGLGAPFTINTMPEKTLLAFHDHGEIGSPMPVDGGDSEATLAEFTAAGVDVDALAATLQADGAASFVAAWNDLMALIDRQRAALGA